MSVFMISIHAPREGSDSAVRGQVRWTAISIHAPREGSDTPILGRRFRIEDISIHAPREGSDAASLHGHQIAG